MARILVTAFVPFAGRRTNLSQQALDRFRQRRTPRAWRAAGVAFALLPVEFHRVGPQLSSLLRRHDPSGLMMVGENRRARRVSLERVALNVAHARLRDNAGCRPQLEPVDAGGPLALATTFSLPPIVAALRKRGIPADISHHAGTFVCNAAFYLALSATPRVLFMHVPGGLPADRLRRSLVERLADAYDVVFESLG